MPQLPDYTIAFRAWVRHFGGLDYAQDFTGIGRRKLERMHAGTARTPPNLLRELADGLLVDDLRRQLLDAAAALDAANPATRRWTETENGNQLLQPLDREPTDA